MIRNGRWKLTYKPLTHGHILQLFDVEADPVCLHNAIEQYPDMASALWHKLYEWINRAPEAQSNL